MKPIIYINIYCADSEILYAMRKECHHTKSTFGFCRHTSKA